MKRPRRTQMSHSRPTRSRSRFRTIPSGVSLMASPRLVDPCDREGHDAAAFRGQAPDRILIEDDAVLCGIRGDLVAHANSEACVLELACRGLLVEPRHVGDHQ